MRKVVIISAISVFIVFALIESGILDALVVFLLSGSLPGMPIVLSPSMMMALLVAAAWVVLSRMTALGSLNLGSIRRIAKLYGSRQHQLPKRRYSRI